VLGRYGTDNEVAGWTASLAGGMPPRQVAVGFTNSLEHRINQVDAFSRAFLHRATDPMAMNWVAELMAGVSEQTVSEQILNSPEYQAAHTDPALMIRDLYLDVLGRQGTTAEIGGWQSALAAGATRESVVAGFVQSAEANDQIVASLYATALHRPREGQTAAIWTTLLEANKSASDVANGILSSPEFQQKS